jgi:hypothetical protein
LFVPLCVAAQSLLSPLGPNDFWYHARAGRFIVESGAVPTQNLFTLSPPWVSPATPFYYQSWISEVAFYKLLQSGGLSAVVLARAACLALAFALVVASAWQRSRQVLGAASWDGAAKIAAAGALWALAMGNNNFDARPQMFSVPLFALWCLVLWRWRFLLPNSRLKWSLGLWIVMAAWVNTHGAFFTAILVTLAYSVGAAAEAWRSKGPDERLVARDASILLAGSVLAACLNPRGLEIFAYVRRLATLGAGQKYIQEWQAPEFSLEEWNSVVFYLAPLAVLALFFLARKRATSGASTWGAWSVVSPGEWLVAALLLAMALRDKRSILWFALWFAPLWATLWAAARGANAPAQEQVLVPRAVQIANAAICALLLASLALCAPRVKAGFDWPPAFRARFAPTPADEFPRGFAGDPALLLDRTTPVEAVAWLRQNPPRARVWHDMVFGSYLMWATQDTAPDARGPRGSVPASLTPMADPRIELYPDAFWDDYARLSSGPPDAPQVLEARGFSDALLDPELQAPLIRRLLASGQWKKVFSSPPAVLLRAAK